MPGSVDDAAAENSVTAALQAALRALDAEATLAIAFSGGIDSTALLHAAVACAGAGRCIALHVHHGLSSHAEAWLAHCENFALTLGVRFAARRLVIPSNAGCGPEAAARAARYQALRELCAAYGARVLLLAHHADDQAETVLLQLLRGAGLPGLAAMPANDFGKAGGFAGGCRGETQRLIRVRPLLTVSKAEIKAYALQYDLQWIEDESNQQLRYPRNVLRHTILPRIAARFPAYRSALARCARHAADAQNLLDELAQLDLQRTAVDQAAHILSRAALIALSQRQTLRSANLLRYWIRMHSLPALSKARLDDLLSQLQHARAGAAIQFDHAGYRLRAYRDRIWWEAHQPKMNDNAANSAPALAETAESVLRWDGQTAWRLARWCGTLLFVKPDKSDPAAVPLGLLRSAPLCARARRGGERMRVSAHGARRTLKNLFQEAGLPVWRRKAPLIYLGNRLLFVPYLGLNHEFACPAPDSGEDARMRFDWQEN